MNKALWCLLAAACAAYICGPVCDPDLWWHIAVGRWILAHHSIPRVDYWNLYGQGQPWRAYSWSNEILFALADSAGGIHGLLLLKFLYATALALSLFYCMSCLADDGFVGALLGAYATIGCYNHFTLRPQSLIWVLFVWIILLADLVAEHGLNARRAAGLFLVMMAWANSHVSAILGIMMAGGWVLSVKDPKLALKVAAISLAGTFVTPYMGGEWLTFFSTSGHPLQLSSITEFKPATIFEYSTGFVVILVMILGIFLHYRPRILEPAKICCAIIFVLGGLAVTKFIPFAVIAMCALIAVCWRRAGSDKRVLGNLGEAVERLEASVSAISGQGMSFLLICVAFVNIQRTWKSPIALSVVPVIAVDFMQKHDLPHPILNTFGNGGYLIYRYMDSDGNLEHKVPIDGRTNVMTYETWTNFMASLFGKPGWHKYIDQVKPQTILWRRESPFTALLLAGKEFCEVFVSGTEDDGYNVFVRSEFFEAHKETLKSSNCSPEGRSETTPIPHAVLDD